MVPLKLSSIEHNKKLLKKCFCDLWLKVHKFFSGWCLHWADAVDRAILQAVEAEGWWFSNRTGWLVGFYTRLIYGRQRLLLIEAARTPNTQSRTVRQTSKQWLDILPPCRDPTHNTPRTLA